MVSTRDECLITEEEAEEATLEDGYLILDMRSRKLEFIGPLEMVRHNHFFHPI